MKGLFGVSDRTLLVIAVAGLAVMAFGTGDFLGSVGQGPSDDAEVNPEIAGQAADIDVVAKDVADSSSPAVSAPADLYQASSGEYVTSGTTNADGSRTTLTGLVAGDVFKVHFGAENADYYGDVAPSTEGQLVDSLVKRADGQVYETIASSNVETTFYDADGNSATSITIGSGETYSAERMKVRAGAESVAYNYEYLYFNTSKIDASLDDIRVDGATQVDVPERLSSDFTHAFKVDQAGNLVAGEEPALMAYDSFDTGQIEFDMESGQDPAGTIEIVADDAATYRDVDGTVKQGHSDENDNDVGVSTVTQEITIN